MSQPDLGKALLVEDDTLVAMLAEDQLLGIGFEPVWVETAAQALAAVPGGGFRLAMVDVGLPDMRGDVLTARIRTMAPDLPIVVATGYDGADIKNQFSADPATAVLAKPYSESDLRAVIAALGVLGAQA